jgi:hypothetical protein
MSLQQIQPRPRNQYMGRILASLIAPGEVNGLTLDANDLTAVFSRELEWIDQKLQEEKFAPLKAELLVDYDARGGAGVKQVTWRKVKELGAAAFIGDGTTTLPRVDVVGTEYTRTVKPLGVAWDISVLDLASVAMNPSIRLDAERKKAAVMAVRRLHDKTAMIGNTDLGWTGLVNDANVPLVTAVTGNWNSTATADQILEDFNKLYSSVYVATKENFEPDTFLIPTSLLEKFNKPIGTNADRTLMTFIRENYPSIKRIETTYHLETASAGTSVRAMVYKKSKDVLLYGANNAYTEEPPQRKGLMIETPAHGLSSGLQIFQPLACAYMDVD